MILTLQCIRHGESASNAGLPTDDHMTIPLTERGWQQAQEIADRFTSAPDLIVVSPMLRTRQTAEPTIRRYPGVPVLEMDIGEFTPLSPELCQGTTKDERQEWRQSFWSAADHDSIHGPGAESFAMFWGRVDAFVRQVEHLYRDGIRNALVFGHGQFLQAVRYRAKQKHHSPCSMVMKRFWLLNNEVPVRNASGFILGFKDDFWWVEKDDGDYLPFAIKLFTNHEISQGLAAAISGLSRARFIEQLGIRGIPVIDYDPGELEEELRVLRDMAAINDKDGEGEAK